jgi:hypothetical protein
MGDLLSTVLRTAILDDSAFQEWQERPNVFLRGIVLIIIVSLVAGLAVFAVNLVAGVSPVDVAGIEEGIQQSLDWQYRLNPGMQDPEVQEIVEGVLDTIVPMVSELSDVDAPLPKGITGFFNAFGGWLSRALTAIGGWMLYGALVLIFVNLLGGSAKLGEFLGTVSVYVVPGLLGLFSPILCLGPLAAFIAMVWSIVVYIKATSVVGKLDGGRAILAVVAPFFCVLFLGILLAALLFLWIAILS